MEAQSTQANEPVDDGGFRVSEDMVGRVKGTGRPDLDEDEDDDVNDVSEQGSVLSDFEEEDDINEVVVGSMPLVIPTAVENNKSPRLLGSSIKDSLVEVQGNTKVDLSFGEGRLSLEHSVDGDFISPIVSSTLTGEESSQHLKTISKTDYLSESYKDGLSEPGSDSEVHFEQQLDNHTKEPNGGEPLNLEHPAHGDSFSPIAPSKLAEGKVEENNPPLQMFSKTYYLSESDEDVLFGPTPDLRVLFKETSGVPMDTVSTSVTKDNVPQSGEGAPQAIPSPKLDHVDAVTLRTGGPEVDSMSSVKRDVNETTRKKGTIMRLGSKEAEELLQLDLSKAGRAIFPSVKKSPKTNSVGWGVDDLGPDELSRYVETPEVKETYLDTVLDMEDVLLESDDNRRPSKNMFTNPKQKIERDGSLTASTSGISWGLGNRNSQLATNHLVEVAWVEVVGARQRRGGASFSERVVGVQEHTVYRMLVRGTDGQEWEIERRYRDFVFLYQQLNRTFPAESTVSLPTPWDRVRAESRKLFGNTSPNVVEVRSALIQVCLQSLLQAGPPLSTASPFLRFLFPTTWSVTQSTILPRASSENLRTSGSGLSLDEFGSEPGFSPRSDTTSVVADGGTPSSQSVFGKTIRLRLEVHKKKPLAQQMQSQHHSCAGCYRPLTFAVGFIPGLAQSLGLSGPRWCEYSGQLYCSSCHLNETAVIPAYAVQHWDFGLRPVSQLAKAYLDSIYDKPMLCVSAVNPYLYFRVPILVHLRETRKRLSRMLACIRCPSRSRIQGMVGSRRYLLESNDFYALRDLTDLSKGAFAGLPTYMNTLLEKLTVHIKCECSICHEMGEPCGAGKFCRDPLDIIFPFQDDGVVRCLICQLPFHKLCFRLIKICPSCSGESSLDIAEMSQAQQTSISDASNSASSLKTTPDALAPDASVQADRQSKIKVPNFLSGILKSKDSNSSREAIPDRQDSIVLDMISGPLEL
ncbi:uncharacterized protein [Physcomitrium patens]|uniref:PX domain-containing protein n=1 Tax=Physcomitrium patens TaxID=3218 RepID=A0A2K1IBF3_PHYPA|nr:uncharacterized protein LOC112278004 [Physcomitrium patens]XP_024366723.1 uncharacterized protein LOC112278004 [Physcomitrium patens]XP_024366724.1 uncharacterized protein LOC112278004 [Physcomitrium patens]XP_024366725.1 uncharacterized protein LOC112278004 [Physcomitrium patens]XP_024366726.1 uncharacterized protein LOC112278004 [Physcomitrium patens]XP_024366727.1 uncharacterized protein LOC112278004 [Physcomitrium patens]PNR26599.1 hypothetical protein PHYPA_030080 [Physcomitrium paten|eukprot:XP_024366722.1 uncharacterized protein LOC112278004 [Physcomitrella patens]